MIPDVWDIYFAGLVHMSYHPGATRDGPRATLDELARVADEMVRIRCQRLLRQELPPRSSEV